MATLWPARKQTSGTIASRCSAASATTFARATEKGIVRHTLGDGAVALVATAIEHIHHIDPAIKGTWGAYDLEWIARDSGSTACERTSAAVRTKLDDLF